MLKKCLKYDLRANLLIWIILTAAMLAMSVPGGFAVKAIQLEMEGAAAAVSGLIIFVYYILGVVYLVSGIGLGVYRFYQNFRTDEAYLTFTLPVKRKTLLHSKLISTFVIFVATLAVICVALIITFAIAPHEDQSMLSFILSKIKDELAGSYESHGFFSVVYIGQVVVLAIEAITALILICFSVANRTTSYKNRTKTSFLKNLAAVFIFYIGAGLLLFPIAIIAVTMITYSEATAITGTLTFAESKIATFLTFVMFTMLAVIFNVLLYKDNLNMIKNKLNLT